MAGQLEEATASGADHVFNPMTDKNYVEEVKKITNGGVHAAVNFTASKRAYDATPPLIRINGIMMCVGIPNEPLSYMAMDVAMNKYRIGGSNNGTPQMLGPFLGMFFVFLLELFRVELTLMRIEFTAKHGISPHVSYYKIEQINEMIDSMHDGKARGRLAVKWD